MPRADLADAADSADSADASDSSDTRQRAAVLAIDDLKTWFPTRAGLVKAVNGVTLTVAEAESVAIVGESGSGKSVTGLTVMQLFGRSPAGGRGPIVSGRILFRGRDGRTRDLLGATEADMARVRGKEIAMIFQDPMSSLNPVFPIGEQIAEPIRIHQQADRKTARQRAIELLRDVGIPNPEGRIGDYPHQLSGGMRQRVMIAIALACAPSLLIADEPTTALDVTIQAQVLALLTSLQRRRGMAMIFVTHDLKLVETVADRVAVMYASQIVEEGPVAEVLGRPRHPYTRALLSCSPYGRGHGARLEPIPGAMPSPLQPPPGCRFHPRCRYAIPVCQAGEPALEPVDAHHGTRCIRWRALA